jgi:serine/threonine protein kinase
MKEDLAAHEENYNVMGRYMMDMTKEGHLGEGSFSICRKGIDTITGETVAIKVYKVRERDGGRISQKSSCAIQKYLRQVSVLKDLRNEFIPPTKPELWHESLSSQTSANFFVRLLDYSKSVDGTPGPDPSDGKLYIVTELAQRSLKDTIQNQRLTGKMFPYHEIKNLVRSILSATAALHAQGYVHLDLKPENMMFFNGRLKIIDVDGCVKIGSTLLLTDPSLTFSPCYCAPEWAAFLQEGSTAEIVASPTLDSWSIGLTLCECVTLNCVLKPAYAHFMRSHQTPREVQRAFIEWLADLETSPVPSPVSNLDETLGDLLYDALLVCDPDIRLTPAECLSCPYLNVVADKL